MDKVVSSPFSHVEQLKYGVPSRAIPAPARQPIVHVYSRRRETKDTCPAPAPSSSDPLQVSPPDLDLPIALRKGKHQCQSTYSIANLSLMTA